MFISTVVKNNNNTHQMKKLILIVTFITLSLSAYSQTKASWNEVATDLIELKKAEEDAAPKKTRAVRNTKFLKVNYKKSNDIISIKAYRKSLKDKLRRKKLC